MIVLMKKESKRKQTREGWKECKKLLFLIINDSITGIMNYKALDSYKK